jgi:hypothetical protein
MNMTRNRWWTVAGVALTIAVGAVCARAIEWVDVEVPTVARNEAARDRFYAAKSLVRRLGGEVAAPRSLEALPPPGAVLVLSSSHWDMFPGRDSALKRWVENGGHLVMAEMPFFREQFVPDWAPLRNVDDEAAAARAASEAAAGRGSAARANRERCRVLSEPDSVHPAFGLARSFRVCGFAPTRLNALAAPRWSIGDRDGMRMARVSVGQGSVTISTIRGAFANSGIASDDGALAFAAALDLRPGDAVWFVDEEARPPLLASLWAAGLPAVLLGVAALLLALWRVAPRFGPLALEPSAARRSIGEQIRRTAAFIAAGQGGALHRASLLALESVASRSIADYASLATLELRAQAIVGHGGGDPAALAAAMRPPAQRKALAAAIAELERARRGLLPEHRATRSRPALQTPTP